MTPTRSAPAMASEHVKHIECQCDQCVMHRQFDADNPRPYRCGCFVSATGEQCILESDHAWRHIFPSDLVESAPLPSAGVPEKRLRAWMVVVNSLMQFVQFSHLPRDVQQNTRDMFDEMRVAMQAMSPTCWAGHPRSAEDAAANRCPECSAGHERKRTSKFRAWLDAQRALAGGASE